MKSITLTGGQEAIVDDEWFPVLSKHHWHLSVRGYAQRSIRPGKSIFMHQVIAMTPTGLTTDHINGNKLDNRSCNLRFATNAENCRSRRVHKDNKSGFKGVSKQGQKWQAAITVDAKATYLGVFATPEEAARAYDSAARIHHGDFALLNFRD